MKRIDLLTIGINLESYERYIDSIIALALNQNSSYVCVANVHMLVEAYFDSEFKKVVNGADVITPDGMPLVKAAKILYGVKQDRVAGMTLLPDLLKKSSEQNISVFFYGGTSEMLEKTRSFCLQMYPNLSVVGAVSPPFRKLSSEEEQAYIKAINDSGAKFVFVALGCPKQEKWMASMRGKINACMLGIGGALPVMIGIQKRAPDWMQKASLEWLYRLMQEPKRLFKRYAITNSVFLYILFVQYAKQGFKSKII